MQRPALFCWEKQPRAGSQDLGKPAHSSQELVSHKQLSQSAEGKEDLGIGKVASKNGEWRVWRSWDTKQRLRVTKEGKEGDFSG